MTPKTQFPSYFTGHSFLIFLDVPFSPLISSLQCVPGLWLWTPSFNSDDIFQSLLLSWFYYLLKFPAQLMNSFMNPRLKNILKCLLDISAWISHRHFNLCKSKIEFLLILSPIPCHKTALLTAFPFSINDNCTKLPFGLQWQLNLKITEWFLTSLISNIKSVREFCGLYLQNIYRMLSIFPNSPISNNTPMVGANNISRLPYWNSFLTDLSWLPRIFSWYTNQMGPFKM